MQLLRAEIADLRAALIPAGEASAGESEPAAAAAPSPAGSLGASTAPSPTPLPHTPPPGELDEPEVVQATVEEAVESTLQQTVSRRELFGRRPGGEE